MSCPSASPCPFQTGVALVDYHHQHIHTSTIVYKPTNKQELVWAVLDIEQRGLTARAIGSDMALSRVGYSEDATINTEALNRHVLRPFGATALAPGRVRNGGTPDNALESCIATEARNRNPLLVFVEGGMKIHELLADLKGLDPALALPAMGAGGKQGVVGALATGTHGSEVDRQPLIDAIRAVHLVGPGGQEWWIERSNGWSVKEQLATAIPDWCGDTIVRYDDMLFYSALVGVGRLGVIYAVVLEVEAEYWLEEWRTPNGEPWAPVRAALEASISSGYDTLPTGIFYTKGPLTFLQIALNPNDLTNCWTVGRRRAPDQSDPVGLTKDPHDPITFFCYPVRMPWVLLILDQLRGVLVSTAAVPSAFIPEPTLQAIAALGAEVFVNRTLDEIRNVFQTSPNFGAAMSRILIDYPFLMSTLTNMGFASSHSVAQKVGRSGEVMDQADYDSPSDCYMGVGSEYHFNARTQGFLAFIDEITTFARSLGGIPGYISLRFIRHTDAFIGMERFPLTVALELGCLSPWPTADTFLTTGQAMAIANGGIPHWGQKLYGSFGAAGIHKSAMDAFRSAVATVESGHPTTFRSAFSAEQGLDPPAAAPSPVSVKALLAAARTLAPSDPPPATLRALARLFTPSLRMNPDGVDLPRGRACRFQRGLAVRDLARRLL